MITFTSKVQDAIRKEQDGKCIACGRKASSLEIYFIHPKHLGGMADMINVAAFCTRCMSRRGDLLLDEFVDNSPIVEQRVTEELRDYPSTITRRLLIFYMAGPILRKIDDIKCQYDLDENEYIVLGRGLWNYFNGLAIENVIVEEEARRALKSLKMKIGARTLRDIYTILWKFCNK